MGAKVVIDAQASIQINMVPSVVCTLCKTDQSSINPILNSVAMIILMICMKTKLES